MAQVTTSEIITLIRGFIKDSIKSDGQNAFQYSNSASFKLSEPNVSSSTIIVYLNGTALDANDWSYNSDTNKVTVSPVTSGVSVSSGDSILITFSYYEKYSDTEIQGYIKSSLIHFTRHRYKKHFYMNTSNNVVTRNGINPNHEEADIIALVTSIEIDPKNIRVVMPDFSITPEENKSKREQIDEVIEQFTVSYGVIDFLEKE